MEEERYKKLGSEKQKEFDANFDEFLDYYQLKAFNAGYAGKLKFVKEKGRVIIYVVI